jgi:hypothetical protein
LRTARILHHGRLLECLEALKNNDGLTRNQLADRLSLQPVTISLLIRRLIDAEMVVGRIIHSGKTRGRPVTTFFINPAGLYFMGVHVDAQFISCGLIDLQMNRIGHAIRPVRCESGLETDINSVMRTAVFESQAPEHRIFGVGICVSNELAATASPENRDDWKIRHYDKEAATSAYVESGPHTLQLTPELSPDGGGSLCFGAALLLQKSLFAAAIPQ